MEIKGKLLFKFNNYYEKRSFKNNAYSKLEVISLKNTLNFEIPIALRFQIEVY